MSYTLLNIIFIFCVFSILGWIVEEVYKFIQQRRLVNRGLFIGPYLPIYGFGALVAIIIINITQGFNPIVKAGIYFTVLTVFEFTAGEIAEYLFKVKLWDYSKEKFQFKGYVCLKFSLYWLLLIYVFEHLLFSVFIDGLTKVSINSKILFSEIVLICLLFDVFIIIIKGRMKKLLKNGFALRKEYLGTSKPLLENPAIKELENSKHHRNKTRLEHVKEVAWLSFIWAEYLDLDTRATIRGSLLQDLFYYDPMNRKESLRWHAFVHPSLSLKNAQNIMGLTSKEEDIIKKHMWPLTVIPPFYLETLIVCLVDKYCSAMDYLGIFKNINIKLKLIFSNKI